MIKNILKKLTPNLIGEPAFREAVLPDLQSNLHHFPTRTFQHRKGNPEKHILNNTQLQKHKRKQNKPIPAMLRLHQRRNKVQLQKRNKRIQVTRILLRIPA